MMQAPFSKASKKYLAVTSKLVWLLVKGTKPSYSAMPYLIFVIFFTLAKFLENRIYTEKRSKLPIFRSKSACGACDKYEV